MERAAKRISGSLRRAQAREANGRSRSHDPAIRLLRFDRSSNNALRFFSESRDIVNGTKEEKSSAEQFRDERVCSSVRCSHELIVSE